MRVIRLVYLTFLIKFLKINLNTFIFTYKERTLRNIWIHSKGWRFNWE